MLWKQIIDYAKDKRKPVVFITNEKKKDWWFQNDKKDIFGPQAELIEEFLAQTEQIFHMYRLPYFLKKIEEYFEIKVKKGTLEHIEKIETSQSSNWKSYKYNKISKLNSRIKNSISFDSNVEDFDIAQDLLFEEGLINEILNIITIHSNEYDNGFRRYKLILELSDYLNINTGIANKMITILLSKGFIEMSEDGFIHLCRNIIYRPNLK